MRISRVHNETAQGVVEFAVIISLLLSIFLGTLDFGRFLYYTTAIRSAARVGAETASNHCPSPLSCNTSPTPTGTDYVIQATVCEAAGKVSLLPSISCSACIVSACSNGPCSTTCTPCQQDVCVAYYSACAPGSGCTPCQTINTGAPGQGQCAKVIVGYNFQPISFLMRPFFASIRCFAGIPAGGSEPTHTLCASAEGQVS